MDLMTLPGIKDYWSSEWITQITFFGDVRSRFRFLRIFLMMHMGNNTTEESNRAVKRAKKIHRVIEYIEKQLQKYFSLYALVALTFRAKPLAWRLCAD
jgi:hypothetical protein